MAKRVFTKKTKNINNKSEGIAKNLRILLLCALAVIIFYPPYLRGLYFEEEQLPAQILVFSVFLIFWIYKLVKGDRTLRTPIEYAAFGFVVIYFISIFVAVSTRAAIGEWLKYCMYFAVFYMIANLVDTYKSKLVVLGTIIASAVGVSIIGLDAAAGSKFVKFLNSFFKLLGIENDLFFGLFVQGRIHSTIQYPNALAVYLVAVFFICMGLLMTMDRPWIRAILGGANFILFITFILTQSRGVQLLLLGILIIFVLVMPRGNKIKAMTYFSTFAIVSLVFGIMMSSIISPNANEGGKVWIVILIGTGISAALGLVLEHISNFTQSVSWKIYIGGISGLICIVSIILIYVINASVPAEISHGINEEYSWKTIGKSVHLIEDKEYILSFEVSATMQNKEAPHVYRLDIRSKDQKNIMFEGHSVLLSEEFYESEGVEKKEIRFKVPKDSKLIDINFINYYPGTKVIVDKVKIIDYQSSKIIKNMGLKNKYNLESVINRFENLQYNRSFLERIIFYKDGLSMFCKKWFLGAGGGAWPFIYFSNQSYLYSSTQAHNYPLQVAIETGILGFIVLLVFVGGIIWRFILYKRVDRDNSLQDDKLKCQENNINQKVIASSIFTAIVYMLIHSIIDFDLSLSAVMLVLWQLLAILNSQTKVLSVKDSRSSNLKYTPLIGIVITLIVLFIPINFSLAKSYAESSSKASKEKDINLAIKKMSEAVAKDPWMANYRVAYANLLVRNGKITKDILEEANNSIKKAEELGKNDPRTIAEIGSYYIWTQNIDKGLDMIDKAQELRPFSPLEWQQRVYAYNQVMNFHITKKDYDKALKIIDKALSMIDEAREVNKNNLNPFVFNEDTMKMLEKLKYIKENLNTGNSIDANQIIFYSINVMDTDTNSVPDQWTKSDEEAIDIKYDNESMMISKVTEDNEEFIYTRHLDLKENKSYTIEIELKDENYEEDIYYMISGLTDKSALKKINNKYITQVKISGTFNPTTNYLAIYINNSLNIKSVQISEN